MKKLRDLIVLLVVAAAFAISLTMLRRAVGSASPWFALMVMFTFLGLVAFASPLFLLQLPAFLRKERKWETNGRFYKALRVPAFGALLRRTPLRYLNPLVYLMSRSFDRASPDRSGGSGASPGSGDPRPLHGLCMLSRLVERSGLAHGCPGRLQYVSGIAPALDPDPHRSASRQNAFKSHGRRVTD